MGFMGSSPGWVLSAECQGIWKLCSTHHSFLVAVGILLIVMNFIVSKITR